MAEHELRVALRQAVRELSERGLRVSAKWAAEQLFGLSTGAPSDREMGEASDAMEDTLPVPPSPDEEDRVLLAKTYFDVNEFRRAAHVLRDARGACGRFLRWYSLYLAGERRQAEETAEERGGAGGAGAAGLLSKSRASNGQLPALNTELQAEADAGRLDGYGYYIHGIVLREMQQVHTDFIYPEMDFLTVSSLSTRWAFLTPTRLYFTQLCKSRIHRIGTRKL